MMATTFSPEMSKSHVNTEICQREWVPVAHLFLENCWKREAQKMLDTLKVLVEYGAGDPVETTQPEFNYETAISLFNLEASDPADDALEYLLRQVDTSQFEELNWSSWLLSPDLTVKDQELVISHITRLACLSQKTLHLEYTLGCLLNNMRRLSQFDEYSRESLDEWRKTIFWENLNKLIDAKTDRQKGFDFWTVLRLLSNPQLGFCEDVRGRLNEGSQMWLLWLEECGIDNRSYLEENHDFHSNATAYPLLLEYAPTVGKEGEVRWDVPEIVMRFLYYDCAHVDLNECHTRSYRDLCSFRNSSQ